MKWSVGENPYRILDVRPLVNGESGLLEVLVLVRTGDYVTKCQSVVNMCLPNIIISSSLCIDLMPTTNSIFGYDPLLTRNHISFC
jgi:hypothetical protein